MSLDTLINNIVDGKRDATDIFIDYGVLISHNIFNKNIEKQYCDQLLSSLLNKYKFINKTIIKYIENNKLLIFDEKLTCLKLNLIASTIINDKVVSVFNKTNVSNIEFPCKKEYKNRITQNITTINIDDNVFLNIVEENNCYFIRLNIKKNSFLDVSLKKASSFCDIINDIICN